MRRKTCYLSSNVNGWYWQIEGRGWQLESSYAKLKSRAEAESHATRTAKRFGITQELRFAML